MRQFRTFNNKTLWLYHRDLHLQCCDKKILLAVFFCGVLFSRYFDHFKVNLALLFGVNSNAKLTVRGISRVLAGTPLDIPRRVPANTLDIQRRVLAGTLRGISSYKLKPKLKIVLFMDTYIQFQFVTIF